MPALAAIRLPAATTPMSAMVTPPSARAPSTASDARSTMSLSGCLPNLVIEIPSTHTSSVAMSSRLLGFEPEPDRFGAFVVRTDYLGGQADLHPERHVLGVGGDVDQIGTHTGPRAVDHGRHVGGGDAGGGEGHDGERPDLPLGRDVHLGEPAASATGAGVAPVEEAGPARGAIVGHQVGIVPQHQVVDERDLFGHL